MPKIGDLVIGIGANLKGLSQGLRRAESRLVRSARNFEKIGNTMSVNVSLPIIGVGVAAVKAAADFESLQTRLSTLMKSSEAGRKEFEKLAEISSKTPFRIEDIVRADMALQSSGQSAEEARRSLKFLGDIAAVTGSDLGELSQILAKTKAIGTVFTKDLRQLALRGIPIFSMLKDELGLTGEELSKFVSSGQLDFQTLSNVLKKATEDGGRYKDGMLAASKTIKGQFSTLADNVKIALAEVGKAIVENIDLKAVITGLTQSIISAVKWWSKLSPAIKKTVVITAGLLAAMGPLIKAISVVRMTIAGLSGVLALLTSPIGLVVAAIAALAAGLIYAYNNSETFRGGVAGVIAIMKELGKAAKVAFFVITGQFQKAAEQFSKINWNFKQIFKDAAAAAKANKIEPQVLFDRAGIQKSWQDAVGGADFSIKPTAPAADAGGTSSSSATVTRPHITQLQALGAQAQMTAEEVAAALEPVAPQIEQAFAPALEATRQRVEALGASMLTTTTTITEDMLPVMAQGFEESGGRIAAALDDVMARLSLITPLDIARSLWDDMGEAAKAAGKAMMDSSKRGVRSFKELGKAALSAAADVVRAKIVEGVAAVVSDALKKFGIAGLFIGAALGAAAGALFSSVIGGLTVPKLAEGGLAFGPMLSVVGDNPGARHNPEVIAPLDKLQSIIGGGNINVSGEFRIRGRDLVVVLSEAQKSDNFTI